MLRRDFVCAVVSVSFAPRLLLSQQTANPAPPPPAPVPWTMGLNPETRRCRTLKWPITLQRRSRAFSLRCRWQR